MRVVCVVPAKGSSTRFPGKNLATLGKRPLIAHILSAARDSGVFTGDIPWVNTDSTDIAKAAWDYARMDSYMRPPELAYDGVQVPEVVAEQITKHRDYGRLSLEDVVCIALATCPLTRPMDLADGYETFMRTGVDVLHAITPLEYPAERGLVIVAGSGLVWQHPENVKRGTQDFPPTYRITGAFSFIPLPWPF